MNGKDLEKTPGDWEAHVSMWQKAKAQWQLVEKSQAQERMDICRKNTCGHFREKMERCGKCGCFLRVKTKLVYDPIRTVLNGGKKILTVCPDGLW